MDFLFPLLILALLVPMFFGIRKQKREAEKVSSMQESLKVGDSVITTSGLYGTVVDLDETTVDLEIAEEVVTTWLRQAIREVRVEEPVGEETPAVTDAPVEEVVDQTETRLTKD
ncbi:preprotein translocase subunit YajC [Nocardia mangyaensis]|uniref:preprotein translocase subunit YajC n=1 Tax=Nocardia mangyaensis TaxID=2213200 RepID=UPI002675E0CE|nr:preprotein translocase subunit YajC [Nocardia mangyaensis]MDO3646656.1 preprotein translocase subunit YajC [Nocardia mangyaensis]